MLNLLKEGRKVVENFASFRKKTVKGNGAIMKFNKLSKILGLSVTSLLASAFVQAELLMVSPEEAGFDSEKLEAIIERADSVYEAGSLPNYVIALAKDGKVFFTASRGNRTIGIDSPVGMDTLFPLASMSKPIASSAIFHLIEQGKLTLDSELSEFYPEFESMLVAENGSLDAQFEDISRPITILDLLTHTSGIEYRTAIGGTTDVADLYEEIGLIDACLSASENMELLAQLPLIAQPGEIWNYSISVDVLGAVVEAIAGIPLGRYVAENLFSPIGISESAWRHSDQTLNEKFATLYNPPFVGQTPIGLSGNEGIEWNLAASERYSACPVGSQQRIFDMGGSGLVGNATDYLIYGMMIANLGEYDGKRILSEDSVNKQLTKQVTAAENIRGIQGRFFGAGFGYSLDPDTGLADSYGWGGSNGTGFFVDPLDGTVGVLMTSCYRCRLSFTAAVEEIVDGARLN